MNAILIRSNPVNPCPRTEKMARFLLERGYGVTVLAWDRDADYTPKEEMLNLETQFCRIIRIGIKGQFAGGIKKNLKGLIKFQRFIYKWLKKNKNEYDVIQAIDLDDGFIAQIAAQRFHKIFIYDIADYYSNGHGYTGVLKDIVNVIENHVINKAFATIICTEERREEIRKAHPKRLYVVHNTPNLLIEPLIQNSHDRVRFAYVGVFGKTRFLFELTEYISTRKDCELHIGGFGANMESYFEKKSEEFDNIFFYGRVPYHKTIEIEKKCDILPIIYDPTLLNHVYAAPNKFYEALALGKPMIMAKGTGMSSVVEEYDIGETIEYDIKGLEHGINRLIEKKEQWHEIGKREQNLYIAKYSWEEMKKRLNELYLEVELQID